MPLASIALHFLGSTNFAWWAVVVLTVGVALLWFGWRGIETVGRGGAAAGARGADGAVVNRAGAGALAVKGQGWQRVVALAGGAAGIALGIWGITAAPRTGQLWALLLTGILGALAIWLFYRRVYVHLGRRRVWGLYTLRLLGLICLLFLLFEPALAFVKSPTHKSKLGIVIDASGSMSVNDQANTPSRYQQSVVAARLLVRRLRSQYICQLFAYDGKHAQPLKNAAAYNAVAPDGVITDLPAAIHLATRSGAHAVVLFSDGIQNGPRGIEAGLAHNHTPVYTVGVGSTAAHPSDVPDIAIVRVEGPQSTPVDNTVTLTALVQSTALSDRMAPIYLKMGRQILKKKMIVLHSGSAPQAVQFHFTPHKLGRNVVEVAIPVQPEERSGVRNQQEFPMLVTAPRIAVLYIEGRVRPEVGPLIRALETDPNLATTSLIQTRPGRFALRGAAVAGMATIPTTLKEWEHFKVVILGDLSAHFLSRRQQTQLRQAVQAGAGFVMIGGQQNFVTGGWAHSPLAPAFAISLARTHPSQINSPFVPQLTAFGENSPIFQGITTYFPGPGAAPARHRLPPLAGCVAFAGPQPGATVLAVDPRQEIGGKPADVLVVRQYGKGRAAAFAGDTTYRWQLMRRAMGKKSPYDRFWGQLLRYLAGVNNAPTKRGPSVTPLIARDRYKGGQTVRLRAAVTNIHGQSTAYANTWAVITTPAKKTVRVAMHAISGRAGMYLAHYRPSTPGHFRVVFAATQAGKPLGQGKSDFDVMQGPGEMDKLAAEPRTLQRIARMTGGGYVPIAHVGALVRQLKAALPAGERRHVVSLALYSPRGFFVIFIVLLSVEWFLRRKWHLQ